MINTDCNSLRKKDRTRQIWSGSISRHREKQCAEAEVPGNWPLCDVTKRSNWYKKAQKELRTKLGRSWTSDYVWTFLVTDGNQGRIFKAQRGHACVLGQSLRCSVLNNALGIVTDDGQRKHIWTLPIGGGDRNLVTESENIYIQVLKKPVKFKSQKEV